jgi:hypothetical protein
MRRDSSITKRADNEIELAEIAAPPKETGRIVSHLVGFERSHQESVAFFAALDDFLVSVAAKRAELHC